MSDTTTTTVPTTTTIPDLGQWQLQQRCRCDEVCPRCGKPKAGPQYNLPYEYRPPVMPGPLLPFPWFGYGR